MRLSLPLYSPVLIRLVLAGSLIWLTPITLLAFMTPRWMRAIYVRWRLPVVLRGLSL